MYCLDSNIIMEILNGNKLIASRLVSIGALGLSTTTITLCELFRGAFLSGNPEKNTALFKNLLKSLDIIDLDIDTCELYGSRYSELEALGKLTQDFDLLIGVICITNNKILITRNKKHFENIKGLKVKQW